MDDQKSPAANTLACQQCNGSGQYRAPYSSVIGPCPACAALPSSDANATKSPAENALGESA